MCFKVFLKCSSLKGDAESRGRSSRFSTSPEEPIER